MSARIKGAAAPVAVVKGSKSPDAAGFEAYLHSPEAKAILTGQGFTLLGK